MGQHTVLGFFSALVAAVFFGSNFVVIKEYDMGDGMYWQFIMAVGVWLCGLITVIVKCIATATPVYYFHPTALTSGIIWSIGNILTVTIIKTIGLALGMSIWCATQLIIGWSTGKWGLLGTPKDTSVKHDELNYLGVIFVFIALFLFFNVKPDNMDDSKKHEDAVKAHMQTLDVQHDNLIADSSNASAKYDEKHDSEMMESWIDRLNTAQKNSVGIVCSVIAGICYGVMFGPVQSMINDEKHKSQYSGDMIDYVFIVYNGIFLSSLFYLFCYNLYMKNKPQINDRAVFPSICGGVIWAVAMNGYFIALDKNNLGVETTFPIVSAGPQIVSSLWGVLYYKEIKGRRNILFLIAAICCSLTSVLLVSLSKFDF